MQGQRSPICNFAEDFLSDNGSTSNDAAVDYQLSWGNLQGSGQNQRSASPIQANIQYVQQHGGQRNEWCFGESRTDRRYEEQEHHSGVNVSNLSADASRRANASLLLQTPRPGALTQDLNLTAVENVVDYLAGHPLRPVESSSEHPSHRSSRSIDLLPGFGELNGSVDARRLPLKRKAVEACHSSAIGGSERYEIAERGPWDARQFPRTAAGDISLSLPSNNGYVLGKAVERPGTRIRIGGGVSTYSSASDRAESSSRNLNLDINGSQQQVLGSGKQLLPEVDATSVESSSSGHSSRLSLRHCLFDLNRASGSGNDSHAVHTALPVPLPRENLQARIRASATRRSGSSSVSGGRNAAVSAGIPSRNVSRSIPMFLPGDETLTQPEQPINWSSVAGNPTFLGNVGSTSRAGSSSAATSFPPHGWSPGARNQQRLFELMRRTPLSGTSGTITANHPMLAGASTPAVPSVPNSHRSRASSSRSGQLDRHVVHGAIGLPYLPRNLASEGRRSIISEQIRHVLDRIRRGESVRFEDMVILDPSVLAGMADLHDRHREMRMDVDNMTYEELLALEERIGNVCTGLSEEAIAKNLKKRIYSEVEKVAEMAEEEPCCICREEYVAGEDLGELNCGHDFHTHCIRRWLMQKNLCPICKTTALNTRNSD